MGPDISLFEVLRGFYVDSRQRIVSADRAVNINQCVQIGKVGKANVVRIGRISAGRSAIDRQTITNQRNR